MTAARVVLVEDDANVLRFVQWALEPLQLDVVLCGSLAEARRAFRAAGASVVITDLSLPDGAGQELLAWLQARAADPAPAGAFARACRTVVFSGGLDDATQRELASLGVWRTLHKPSSVGALMACVSEALASMPSTTSAPVEAAANPADPVQEFFGGDRALYDAYRQACRTQFARDLSAGDAAVCACDSAALRRVAHDLKSVLALLGEASAAACARETEARASAAELNAMAQGWLRLRAHVARLI